MGRFLTPWNHVYMRVGEVGNQQIGLIYHLPGNVRMQVEGGQDPRVRSGDFPDFFHQ